MRIRLKTNNLRIGKRKAASWSSVEQEVIIIPLNIELLPDRLIVKLNYVFENDFHGIKKNKPLIFYYLMAYGRRIKEIHIPIKDNI